MLMKDMTACFNQIEICKESSRCLLIWRRLGVSSKKSKAWDKELVLLGCRRRAEGPSKSDLLNGLK